MTQTNLEIAGSARFFSSLLSDVQTSLAEGASIPFELSILGTIMRHASILGCYVCGRPTFGRLRPVEKIVDLWGLDEIIKQSFPALYRYRIWSEGRSNSPADASLENALCWCARADRVLTELEGRVNDYERTLPKTACSRERIGQLQ